MSAPQKRRLRRVWWFVLMLALFPASRVCAQAPPTPHLLSHDYHPFDPDWPVVLTLLQQKCTGCHLPGGERADLTSYEALFLHRSDSMQLIVPGDPDASTIYEYIAWNAQARAESDLPDEPMMPPDHLEWFTEQQVETFRRWILNGALQYKLPDGCDIRPLLEIDYPSAKQCGVCHPKQFEEWSSSMHAYAQHSPVFEAFNLTLQERTGGTIGTFCTRCHTPVGTALGENGVRRNVHRSRVSMEGVTCIACHRQAKPTHRNSGRFALEPGDVMTTCMYGPFEDSVSHLIGSHPSAGNPFIKTSQFCGNCHDVTTPGGVRLEEAYSEWQNSPAARDGIRCQDCHMGPVQGYPVKECERPLGRAAIVPGQDPMLIPLRHLSDHSFAGPDYSLLPDTEFPHKLDWMYETDYRDPSRLTPYQQGTLLELRRRNQEALLKADQKRYELLSHAARLDVRHLPVGRAGKWFTLDVGVVSLLSGHSFPTGFTAERQAWVELQVCDEEGRLLFVSGDLDSNGDLRDEHSRDVLTRRLHHDHKLLNLQNKFSILTNKGTDRSVVVSVNRAQAPLNVVRPALGPAQFWGRSPIFRIAKGSLPPLKTLRQKYRVKLPHEDGICFVKVRLNFRHLPPTLLDHVGVPHLKHQLEIVEIDSYEALIEVTNE